MESKTNLQQLAKVLAQKNNLPQKDAETFLKKFFDTIIESVAADKVVKIKGLGTFKLIEVQDRESVNVHTGERFIIPGHSKLSFTPDPSLKDMVNKPFADFQTVIINEDTSLEDMEKMPPIPQGPFPEALEGTEATEGTEAIEATEAPAPVSDPVPVPGIDDGKKHADSPAPPKFGALTSAEKWALRLGFIVVFLIGYYLGYYRIFSPHSHSFPSEVQEAEQEKRDTSTREKPVVLAPDTLVTRLLTPQPKNLDPEKKYRIVGTRKTHIMKPGDYLSKIALEEYGSKEFARYIITHNRFADPNNIPVGMEIKLPELKAVE